MALTRVKYKGLSDLRLMSQEDLNDAGFPLDSELRWDKANRHTVFIKDPSDELLEMFAEEGVFQVQPVDAKGVAEGDPVIEGEVLDDTAPTVVDGRTGQESKSKEKSK